jgi:vancomycin resistance protein YoaR
MKNIFKSALTIAALIVVLAVVYIGIKHLQGTAPVTTPDQSSLTSPDDTQTTSSGQSPDTLVEKKNVNLEFSDGKSIVAYKNVPLFSVVKKDDKPISITADGNLAKTLIEKLPEPSDASEPLPSKLGKAANDNFKKIVRGKEGLTIDREKTLAALEAKIKEAGAAATLSVPIFTKKFEGKESFSNKINEMGFNKLIASFSTLHEGHIDDEGRNVNLAIAAKKIDGLIIPPGGKFSFNKVVGPRTRKYGFENAGVISRGKVIPGLGGGICQVSTTLYRTTLKAGLKIDERHNHSIYDGIEYADRGLDAAVAWGYKDFKFSNNLDVPILISASSGKGSVEVSLYAEKQPFESVVLQTRNEQKHPFKTQKKRNSKLKKGEVKVVHPGVTGYTIETYRIITQNGKTREERMSKDRYLTYNRIEEINN